MESDAYHTWIAGLRPGDLIALHRCVHGREEHFVTKVERILPSGRIVTGYSKTMKFKGGYYRERSGWDPGYKIVPLTQEILDRLYLRKLISRCQDINFDLVSVENLEKILGVLGIRLKRPVLKPEDAPGGVTV